MIQYRLIAAVIVFGLITVSGFAWFRGVKTQAYDKGYAAATLECSTAQAEAARLEAARKSKEAERTRAVELGHVATQTTLSQSITHILTELPDETKNLQSCQLDAGDIGLLNRAAAAARAAGSPPAPTRSAD